MTFKMTGNNRIITVYNLLADTKEFIGKGDAYIPAHTGLPAYCTDIEPPAAPDGQIQVFDDKTQGWLLVENHRDKTVYSTVDGSEIYITELGPLPEDTTIQPPPGGFVKWSGSEWERDKEAEKTAAIADAEEKKARLLSNANEQVSDLRIKLMLDMITDSDKEKLKKLVVYLDAVKNLDVNTAPDVLWPEIPDN